jgi:hypothetical protein
MTVNKKWSLGLRLVLALGLLELLQLGDALHAAL